MRKYIILIIIIASSQLYGDKINYTAFTELVYKTSPEVLTKEASKEEALEGIEQAKSRFLPKVDFTGSYTYIQNPMEPIYLNLADLEASIPGSTSGTSVDRIMIMDSPESSYFDLGIKIVQPLYMWGKLQNGLKIYESLYGLKRRELLEFKSQIESEVKALYYTIGILGKIDSQIAFQEEVGRKLKSISSSNYDNGFIEYSDYLEIEYLFLDLERSRIDIKYQIDKALNRLQSYYGEIDSIEDLDLDLDYSYSDITVSSGEEYINNRIAFNPLIRKLYKVLNIKELELKVAESSGNFLPDLALQLDLGYSGSRLPFIETDWYRKDDYGLNLTLAFSTTLFDGGYSKSDVRIKSSSLYTAHYQMEIAEKKLKEEAINKILLISNSRKKLDNLVKRKDLTGNKKSLSEIKFKQGLILESDYLNDELKYYGDEISFLTELLNFYIDYIALENILSL